MADNNHAVIKIRTDHNENAIEDINHNFRVLTERIKDLNLTISYMDLLRLQEVYEVNLAQEESVRLQNFVSNCWGKLPNYSGVAFSTTGTGNLPLFTFLGYKVSTRDFLVKLPDDQCLYIQGVESKVYKPTGYDSDTSELQYTLTDINPGDTSITVNINPLITNPATAVGVRKYRTYSNVAPGGRVNIPGTLIESHWYTNTGEEVIWSGSYKTTTNASNMTLDTTIIYN